jgi:flagellum-specific peptidoglycan hydrolase FlgJ
MSTSRDQRLAEIAREFVRQKYLRGFPPELGVAQWAAESRWGASESGRFNFFGITYNPKRHKEFRWILTHEELSGDKIASLPEEERAAIEEKIPLMRNLFRVRLKRRFASYSSLEEGIADYCDLLIHSARYARCFRQWSQGHNLDNLIDCIVQAGYATGSGYGDLLKRIIRQRNVQEAIQQAEQLHGKAVDGA